MEELREYGVIRLNEDQLQLGAVFGGGAVDAADPFASAFGDSGVDPLTDVIVTTTPHRLQTGDAAKYDNGGFANVSDQLIDVDDDPDSLSTTFYVRRIDDFRFKLAATLGEAQAAPLSFDAQAEGLVTGGNTLNIGGHGFSNGDRVTYRTPEQAEFRSINVDLNVLNNGAVSGINFLADNIYLGRDENADGVIEGHDFNDGDRITYRVEDPSLAIGGLVDGQDYFVIRTGPYEIQLADSFCEAVGCEEEEIDVTSIDLTPDKTSDEDAELAPADARHLLLPVALGALQNGRTYTVADATANSFQLLDENDNVVNVAVGDATGAHSIGVEGIELTPSDPESEHSVRIDFVGPTPNVTNSLYGPLVGNPPVGESLRSISPPTGDGASSVSAKGSGGGILEVEVPTARANYTPTVTALVAADEIVAEGNVAIVADSAGTVSGYSNSRAGGVIKVGRVNSDLDLANATNAIVGLPAEGVGLRDLQGESDSVQVVANGVDVFAENVVLVSESSLDTRSTASAKGGGLIATARAEASNDVDAQTNVVVGRDARIEADTVDVDAVVDGVFANAKGEATAGGLAGSARTVVNNNVVSLANVLLEGSGGSDTQLTGYKGVDIGVRQVDVETKRSESARFFGFGTSPEEGDDKTTINSVVDADRGVLVTAGPRVLAGEGVPAADVTPLATPTTGGISNLALFVDVNGQTDDVGPDDDQRITWEADAEILSGPSPELEINEAGEIVKAINISVDGGQRSGFVTDRFTVDDVINDDPGEVLFRTNQEDADAVLENPAVDPRFTFRFTFEEVLITNRSDFTMAIGDILPANVAERPLVVLAAMDELTPLEFDVSYAWEPTFIQINHLSNASNQVQVNGQIDNPIGRTEFHSTAIAGNSDGELPVIRVGFDGGLVRTNDLHITSTRGSYSVNALLVHSEGRPTHFTSVVDHPGTSYLRVQGVLRDSSVEDFVVNIDSIETPGTMLIDYRKSIEETSTIAAALRTDVNESTIGNSSVVAHHFRPAEGVLPFTSLPVSVFGHTGTPIDSTYDFQSIVADFLLIEPFDEPCPDIFTGVVFDWDKPGPGVIFDGPGVITLGDADNDGNFRDVLVVGAGMLTLPPNFDVVGPVGGFFGLSEEIDSFTVAAGGSLAVSHDLGEFKFPGRFEVSGVLDVEVGGGVTPLVIPTASFGPESELRLHAEERFDRDGAHVQTALSLGNVSSLIATLPEAGVHVGRGLFTTDVDGDGAAVQVHKSRAGVEYRAELFQASMGDVNGDRAVDLRDFSTLVANFNSDDAAWIDGDLDGDGVVGLPDFFLLKDAFGPSQPRLRADFDGNGRVDLTDFSTLKQGFGVGTSRKEGDANGDQQVDLVDFLILKEEFGATAQSEIKIVAAAIDLALAAAEEGDD